MSSFFNYHMHTRFSDGKGEPADWVSTALELGFFSIGFSEHSPLPFDNTFALKKENFAEYIRTINELKKEYADKIAVYCGLEMDFIPGISCSAFITSGLPPSEGIDCNSSVVSLATLGLIIFSARITTAVSSFPGVRLISTNASFADAIAILNEAYPI